MNDTQQTILALIKGAVEHNPCISFSDDTDWMHIFKICQKAQITPLVYESIEINHCNVPSQILNLFRQSAMYHVVVDEQQQYHISQLTEIFNREKIDYVLLKGAKLKALYPKTVYRPMGDIDILIKEEQYPRIREIMLQLSYNEKEESNQVYPWTFPPHIHFELHKKLIPSVSEDFFDYFADSWNFAIHYREHQYQLTPESEFVFLFTHFAKHYRGSGIGLRHVVDLWLYRKHYPDLDEDYLVSEFKKLHLDKFYANVVDTIATWFDDKEETEVTEIITNTVFQSGSFGTKERGDRSYALRYSKKHRNAFQAKLKFIFELVFLPRSLMSNKYPVLNKWAFLLPVFWVVRWFDILLFKRNRIKRQTERTKQISQDSVDTYQKELNAVGLDFYF